MSQAQSRIITLCRAKGGAGCSFIATNLAISVYSMTRQPTCLIDLDTFTGGSQASLLDLEGEQGHLGPILNGKSDISAQIRKHRSGLDLLAAAPIGYVKSATADRVAKLLALASQQYENIIIDVGTPILCEEVAAAFDYSSGVFVVIEPDIMTIQQTRQFLQRLHELRYPPEKFHLLLNQDGITRDIQKADIEDILQKPVDYFVPYDPQVLASVNRGVPIVLGKAQSSITQAFGTLTKAVLKWPAIAPESVTRTAFQGERKVRPQTGPIQLNGNGAKHDEPALPAVIQSPIPGWPLEKYKELKMRLHKRLVAESRLNEFELQTLQDPAKKTELRQKVAEKVARILDEEATDITSRADRMAVIEEIVNEALGLGPLEDLLTDPTISEIMVNGPSHIYVEQAGKLVPTDRMFTDERQLRVAIDRIVAPIGRRVDESSPMVDARLPDGSRVNVIIPPLSLVGSTITIRKFSRDHMTLQDLIALGSLSDEMAEFLMGAVRAKLSIFISGGTGSGKTTLLNALSNFIPADERIVTIEDAAELRLQQEHLVSLESRPPNIEGKGAVLIRDLVRNALRMRPDRIIVGEVRGGEALDMLQALNTGHHGSLTTGHANTPRDALARLETMVLMAGMDLPVRAIREQIASAIDLVIQQSRCKDGSRKITRVTEITGMEGEVIAMQDIFHYDQKGLDLDGRLLGDFRYTHIPPMALEQFSAYGVAVPPIFTTLRASP